MRALAAVTLVLLSTAVPTLAADADGRFSIRGQGLLTCEHYVRAREAKSALYHQFGGWIDGYLTGVNQYRGATYDITTFETTELLALVVDNHCRRNPKDHFFTVVNSIVARLEPDRLQQGSSSVEVTVGARAVRLYPETLRRAQGELARLGHYRGVPDGKFSEATQTALTAFQRAQGLEPTGFPDQATLWRLLRREAPPR
jgi:hypothetical protein